MHQHYQPRYRLVSHYPFQQRVRDEYYRGYILEIGNGGDVLVSPIGGDRYMMNGYYMLFVSVGDAMLFIDALVAAVPAPPQDRHPTVYTEPLLGQMQIAKRAVRRPRYRLSMENPDRLWRDYPRRWLAHRGYLITAIGSGLCCISHQEYGQYRMDGYYVIFQDEQSARDHVDGWFAEGHTISRV